MGATPRGTKTEKEGIRKPSQKHKSEFSKKEKQKSDKRTTHQIADERKKDKGRKTTNDTLRCAEIIM